MISELGGHDIGEPPHAESRTGLLKGFHHLSGTEPAQIPPLAFGGTGGELPGQGGKIGSLAEPLVKILGQGSILDQDVTRFPFHNDRIPKKTIPINIL